MTFHPYERCYVCSGRAQPGTQNLMAGLLMKYPWSHSMGIYACRDIAGTTVKSNHACGKALDPAVPTHPDGSARTELGHQMVRDLADHAWELGITEIIYNRVRYSAAHPRGAYYGGVHPHRNHVHGSQIIAIAKSLTWAQTVDILDIQIGGDVITRASRGDEVIDLQHALNRFGLASPVLDLDGVPGDLTFAAYNKGLDLIGRSHNEVQISAWNMAHIARVLGGTVDAFTKIEADRRFVRKGTKTFQLS